MAGAGHAKYRPYPAYKPSGVEWLGDIPEGWELFRLKHLATTPLMYGANEAALDNDVNNPRFIRITDIKDDGGLNDETFRSLKPEIAEPYLLERGDILLARSGATVGKSFIYSSDWGTCCFAGYLIKASIEPSRALATWVYRYTQTKYYWDWIDSIQIQATIQNVSAEKYNSFLIAVPSLTEQAKIAAFLDHETAKIDALIAKQQRLIVLLEEKRQAVISHAVTKGLNPDAPLRPSGIDWLGDVPEHWEIKKVAWGFKATKGKNGQLLTKEYCGENSGQYPVYSGQTENEGVLGRISWYEFDFGSDGTLFATTVGAKAMNLSHLFGKLSLSQNCMLITSVWPDLLTRFFFYHFQPLFRFERSLIPDHMQASFRMEDLYQYHHAVPPVSEQRDIASFLDVETDKFADLISKAQSAITLLKERRTALISAAVTGKIDLRDWQPPEGPTDISNEDNDQTEEALA